MKEILDERGGGSAVMQPDIEAEAPATETAVVGAQTEPATTPMAQTERPVDVMKVGGKLLAYEKFYDGGVLLNDVTFETVGSEVADDDGDIVLVTSAAIAAGMQAVNLKERPDKTTQIEELQRLYSVGNRLIENAWDAVLSGRTIGGLELTDRELNTPKTQAETLKVIKTLLMYRNVPIANENGAVAHDEISFGSNDILAATLAGYMHRSNLFGTVRLFLLTDVNGVYERSENDDFWRGVVKGELDPDRRIPVIEDVDNYQHVAGGVDAHDNISIGGMESKFEAAKIAKEAGVDMWIYNPGLGHRERAVDGEIGTYFPAAV